MPPNKSRRAAASDETRRLILAAAKELYLERGFRHAPSRDLAKKAGVAEGTVFAHFPDKASLLAAALHEDIVDVLAQAQQSLPAQGPCRGKLLHFAAALYAYYAKRPELSRALVKESLFLEGEWGRHTAQMVLTFVSRLAEIIGEAKKTGEYLPHADAQLAARSFFAAYYLELTAGLSGPDFDPQRALSALESHVRLWEQGLARAGKPHHNGA